VAATTCLCKVARNRSWTGLTKARSRMTIPRLVASIPFLALLGCQAPARLVDPLAAEPPVAGAAVAGLPAAGAGDRIGQVPAPQVLLRLAEGGDPLAQLRVAVGHALGEFGLEKDEALANHWYRQAAEQGLAMAQYLLGTRYARGAGVTRDDGQAFHWYQRAAAQKLPKAQLLLGTLHALGRGTPVDPGKAVEWYRLAAEQGEPDAQYLLGEAYAKGLGVERDDRQSTVWYRMAADQNHADAQAMVGLAYQEGLGVTQDYRVALTWYLLAAEQASPAAYLMLGLMYETGTGVKRDPVVAYALANLASARSATGGQVREFRDRISSRLDPAEVAQGQELAARLAEPGRFTATLVALSRTEQRGQRI
jgi:TPR repeat protein